MVAVLLAGLLALASPEAVLRDDQRAPGLSYALVQGDQVVEEGAWGVDGDGEPMTPRTPGGFGSVSKSITAFAVLRLVEAGRVGLDDPVVRHVPWFRLAEHTQQVTVRHLLQQTSGISGADGYARSDIQDNAPGAIRRWVEGLAEVTPAAEPGQRHQYSPANAVIAGAVIEAVTGNSFSDVVRDEVFTPLAMADGIAGPDPMPPGHERYFGQTRPADRVFDTSGLPYGYLGGSAVDLAHLAVPLLGDGGYLRQETIAELREGGGYGLGWRVGDLDGTRVVWHAGAVSGYHSIVIAAPDKGWAIAVQQNMYAPFLDEAMNTTAFNALRVVLGGEPEPVPGDPTPWYLAALAGIAALLLAGLVWTVKRRRAALVTVPVGVVAALGGGWWLPASFDLELRHILVFMPDLGQLVVAVAALGGVLAVTGATRALWRGTA
ncbi:serine hydrolase domain-containing protein [Actinokineospora pegani]|uniref:serine hydrolase domain-containing protein n=1 Tax=Actinokineospora pegani TaxID=2654637 RepID=UPI0012EA9DAF|nr:serine hydrolase domain-containing protein [Actinokineospora pegani]